MPIVAALKVVRGKGGKQETAFIPATSPVGKRATSADNSAKGSTLSLVAPTRTATVKVTASAGSGGGTPVSKTYTIKAGTTEDVELPVPAGLKGTYALTLEPQSGGPVYAARTLSATEEGVPGFTIQTLPDDRGRCRCPRRTRTCRCCRSSGAGHARVGRLVLPVARIDRLRGEPQQFGDLFHDDLVDEGGPFVAPLGADLDRAPIDHHARGLPHGRRSCPQGTDSSFHPSPAPPSRGDFQDQEIDVGQLRPASLQALHGVLHQIGERVGPARGERDLRRCDRAAHAPAVAIAAAGPRACGRGRYGGVHHW